MCLECRDILELIELSFSLSLLVCFESFDILKPFTLDLELHELSEELFLLRLDRQSQVEVVSQGLEDVLEDVPDVALRAEGGPLAFVALDDEPWELYDFTSDRSEMTDLSTEFPERVYALDQLWNTWAKENNVTPLPRDLGVGYLKPD